MLLVTGITQLYSSKPWNGIQDLFCWPTRQKISVLIDSVVSFFKTWRKSFTHKGTKKAFFARKSIIFKVWNNIAIFICRVAVKLSKKRKEEQRCTVCYSYCHMNDMTWSSISSLKKTSSGFTLNRFLDFSTSVYLEKVVKMTSVVPKASSSFISQHRY